MSDLKELIGLYWDIAYREGSMGAEHDTKVSTAQITWMEIENEIELQQTRIEGYKNACEQKQEIINGMQEQVMSQQAEIERLRTAINRALADSESGKGWGPDVTVCAYLREALKHG